MIKGCLMMLAACTVIGFAIAGAPHQPTADELHRAAAWSQYRTLHPNAVQDEYTAIQDAHSFGAGLMSNPADLRWSNERVTDLDPGVVCGVVSGPNAFGVSRSTRYIFVEGGQVAFIIGSQHGFDEADARYCGSKPALDGMPPEEART